jgi:hypothetical protein
MPMTVKAILSRKGNDVVTIEPTATLCDAVKLQKANPNMIKIAAWMQRYFYVVAMQGIMQVAIIVVMARFRAGI